MTFDNWFVTYPLPAEIDTMDDTDREQWTNALRAAYKAGTKREWVGLTKDEVDSWELPDLPTVFEFVQFIETKLKEKNT